MTDSALPRPTHAGAVVYRGSKEHPEFLLVTARSDRAEWVLPKGHLEVGEDPATAAAREVREEAGVEVEILRPLGQTDFQGRSDTVRTLFFLARARGSPANTSDEGRRIAWLPEHRAVSALAYPESRKMLATAAEALRAGAAEGARER